MDPTVELINAMFTALRANSALMTLVGGRIVDRAPDDQDSTDIPTMDYPFISLGPVVVLPVDDDCATVDEITVQWDAWTSGDGESYGRAMALKIAGEIKRTLHNAELPLTHNALVWLLVEQVRVIDDPNPAIRHGVVSSTGQVQTP